MNLCWECHLGLAPDGHNTCAACELPGVNAARAKRNLPPMTVEQLEARMSERDPKTFARRQEATP